MPPLRTPIGSWVLVAVLAVAAGLGATATPAVVLLAATGPVVAWAIVLLLVAGRARPPWDVVASTLLGGAMLAASLAAFANELALGWQPSADRGGVPTVIGPVVEEVAKGLVLLLLVGLRRDAFEGPRAGVVWGALVGLGFTWQENLHYLVLAAVQGGWPGLEQGIAVRGVVGGPVHATFTAATGAGLGWALEGARRRLLGPAALGLAVAVVEHVLWNAVGSVLVMEALCGPGFAVAGCANPPQRIPPAAAVLVTLVFLAPGALLAVAAVRWRRRAASDAPPRA
jgi:protease PrsW